ncbi:hypothetical protein BJX63DRAFT_433488 [Aspergillus granulosus]|uniref:Hydrophobin n=1 Tax=Aspergillus granulosus TaxID=176169 RepID=A0ABR4H7M3_9EURO
MRLTPLLLTLTTTLTLTSAIPFSSSPAANQDPNTKNIYSLRSPGASKPTPTTPEEDGLASTRASSVKHSLATLISHDASASYDLTTCPPSHPSRQCCASIDRLADDTTSELGDLIPYLSGVKVSSVVGLQCKAMSPDTPNIDCYESVMCCSDQGSSTEGGTMPGSAQSPFKSQCVPFDEAVEDEKEATEKSKSEARGLAEMSPTPRASARASSSARVA